MNSNRLRDKRILKNKNNSKNMNRYRANWKFNKELIINESRINNNSLNNRNNNSRNRKN